jgi:hypothetical protein
VINAENTTITHTYLKYSLHQLYSFPVSAIKAKIGVLFACELWNFIAVVCQLDEQVDTL